MIIINKVNDIEKANKKNLLPKALVKELKQYIEDIAENVTGKRETEKFNLNEIGAILVIEKGDTIDELIEVGLASKGEKVPDTIPEFVDRIQLDDEECLRIVWVCGNCYGYSVYYTPKTFSKDFDNWVQEYITE